jgi:hypothetical protein
MANSIRGEEKQTPPPDVRNCSHIVQIMGTGRDEEMKPSAVSLEMFEHTYLKTKRGWH